MKPFPSSAGSPLPLGAQVSTGGVNFSLYSHHATSVTLHLFDTAEDSLPSQSIVLEPTEHRTGDIWHIHLSACPAGQLYLYTVDGPYLPAEGLRFNRNKFLQDPYAKAVCPTPAVLHDSDAYKAVYGFDVNQKDQTDISFSELSNIAVQAKCVVVDNNFDWQGDQPLNYPLADCIIYEAHLKGMTRNCAYKNPGSYLGVIEHIPYLKELGISSLELLPVMNFSPYDYSERRDPETGQALGNYWGYNTQNFFAPAAHYAASSQPGAAVYEFRQMVKALHQNGIEVILDVVFNHSGEADELGPTLSFRGLDNPSYYILKDDRRFYANHSGCGNVLNCNHPLVSELIVDCLRYWVQQMHVDGFRFDLASIFRRDQCGELIAAGQSLVEALSHDSVLASTKLIAEPWDAAGAYLLGDFSQEDSDPSRQPPNIAGAADTENAAIKRPKPYRWAEWNDKYRDNIRLFWCASLPVSQLATRLAGSSDIFCRPGQHPYHSINFVTCHDGYTLRDLLSYNEKHNLRNGEQNRDGNNDNFNHNLGSEGPSQNPEIGQRRCRMAKNHLATLMLSAGTPMLLAGDELGKTQGGNNNAYCQDNQLSWLQYDSGPLEDPKQSPDPEFAAYQGLRCFTAQLVALRRQFPILRRREFFCGDEIRWYGLNHSRLCELRDNEQWQSQNACLGLLIDSTRYKPKLAADPHTSVQIHSANFANSENNQDSGPSFFCIFNASNELQHFPLPIKPRTAGPYCSSHWQNIIDTHLPAPLDISLPFMGRRPNTVANYSYPVAAQSVVVLMG